jgi:dolichyldiphosphatase
VRLGVRMADTAWVESGGGASPEVGVSAEGGAVQDLGRDDELRGPSPEANGWATVEAALNWVVSASWHGTYI